MLRGLRLNPAPGSASVGGWRTGPHEGVYWHGVGNPDVYADLVAGRRRLELQPDWASDPGDLGWGVYLTSLKEEAESYGHVLQVRCLLRNALIVPNSRVWFDEMTALTGGNPVRGSMAKLMAAYDDENPVRYGRAELKADKRHYAVLWRRLLLDKGIDGLVVKDWDAGGPTVVFNPEEALTVVG